MRIRRLFGVLTVVTALTVLPAKPAQAEMNTAGAGTKLLRGAVNVLTGWVEIPKRVYETSQEQGTAAGLTWGLMRGFGRGFIRTAAGCYEVFTFPFPAPPNYEPVMLPEYVFIDEGVKTEPNYNTPNYH